MNFTTSTMQHNVFKYYALLIAILLLSVRTTFAMGVIEGQITDKRTGAPLAAANVSLEKTTYGSSTDMEGKFRIISVDPGTYTLIISYVGYEDIIMSEVVVNTARPSIVNVSLTPTIVTEESVTVSAARFAREQRSEVSSIALMSEEIRRFPGGFGDVVRTVATLPGVATVNEGGRNDLLVRGGGPSENLYVVNNMEVPNINHFGSQGSSSGSLAFLNLDFVERVDFSAGGFGVQYGDKLSSVVNIDTRRGRTDRLGGRATISATQFAVDLEGPLKDKGSYIMSARRSYLDLIFKAVGASFIPTYNDFNVLGNVELSPRDELTFLGLVAIDRVERNMEDADDRIENAGIMSNDQNQYIIGVNNRHLINSGYIDATVNLNSTDFAFSQADTQLVEYFSSDAVERELVGKLKTALVLDNTSSLTLGGLVKLGMVENSTSFADTIVNNAGLYVSREELGLPANLTQDGSNLKSALFAEYQRNLFTRLDLTAGVRGNYFDYIDEPFYPELRLSANYRYSELTRFKASVGRYYQAPAYVWVLNPYNKGLKALRNDMAVLGVYRILNDAFRFTSEVFGKLYSDLPAGATPETSHLVISNTGVGYGGREDNFQSFGYLPLNSTGKGIAYGVEFTLQKKYTADCCYGQMSLSLGRSEFEAPNGETYPGQYDQRVVFNISGGFKPDPRWDVSGKFRYWTGAPYTPVYNPAENGGELQNIPEEYLSERLSPGHHLDLRVDRRFFFTNWSLVTYVDIQNIYNNRLQIKPRFDFVKQQIDDKNSIGILPSIGITAEF